VGVVQTSIIADRQEQAARVAVVTAQTHRQAQQVMLILAVVVAMPQMAALALSSSVTRIRSR
jgi:hypothetical protein